MEKPVRRKASFARYDAEGKQIKGHKSAQSSGSGAGAWMGKGKAIGGKEDTVQVETKDGRKYHIPATAAAAAIRATDVQKQMIAKKDLQPSESGDVDLDLSFDFVSKMERGKKIDNNIQLEKENFTTPSTPPRRDLIDGEKNTTPIPKGMSSTDWGSRQRKKPPTPLSLGRKRESMENGRDLASQFSPDSPTIKATNYDDEPLMIVPISATRRANDAGILSTLDSVAPTAMESNNAAMTNLIHQQRMAASKRQNVSQTSLSTKSPGKRKKVPKAEHSSPKKNVFAESSTKLGQKVPFGTNQKANNAQIVRAEESRLFFDGRSEDVHSKSHGHSTDSEKRTSYTTSSYYHSNESQGRRSRQLSARESIGSSNHSMPASFKTAATQEAESSAGHAAFSNSSPSAQNVLGLLFPADNNVPVVPRIETTAPASHATNSERSDASPMLTQKSTPITPYSPLFSDGGNGDSHGHSSSLSSTGGRTPLTAVSTLFGDRTGEQDGKLKTESTSIIRGSTTPNPISSIATEVIREESSLSIERPISVHPSDSIKMQDGHELQLRTSIETDESLPREQRKNLIVNTDPSPRKNQESFDLTDITGTRAKKGPWSQSPLLLESDDQSKNRVSSMIGENDAEMGFGLGLSLLGERDPEKFSKHAQDHSHVDNLTVNRAEISHESSNAIGLDLVPMHTNEKDRKVLTKSPSTTSSTLEGFSINVTPAIEKKEGIKTPDHRVDVPSNVVDIEEILAAGNNAESRGRWSSKLWSVTSAFRSPIRSSFDFNNSTQSPPMRALTLVGKNKDGTSKSSSIRRSASREDIKVSLSKQQGTEESPAVDVYHSMPSSSVLNDQATFSNESVTRPAAAMYTEARSSKHVKRASRIQYLKSGGEESHVQVDMEKNNAMERAILDMIKSPRVADSPSGFTPHLEQFVTNEDSKRKSWNINTIANNKDNNNRASWLVPKRQSHTGARDSELYALAANMQNMLSNAGEGGIDQDSAAVEAMLTRSESQEDGLRRRANRRSIDNMPNTPTFIAEGFEENSIENNERAKNQKTISFHPSKYNAKGVSIAFEEPSVDHRLNQRNHDHHTRLSAYSRPRSGMQFLRNLSTVHGSYDKPENEQEYENSTEKENHYLHYKAGRMSVRHSASLPSRRRISGIFTPSSTNGESSFFSYTGEALQKIKPSQTLFFAGFLFMPWLWFIGGWIVDNDGLFFIEHAKSFGPAHEIPSSQDDDEISMARSSNSDNPYTSGRISRAGWYRDEVQDQTETGSIILHSEEDLRSRKNRISAMLWPDDTVFMNKIRNSGLMEAMRKQTRKGKGMGGALKRQQEKEGEYNPSEDESITVQVAQKMFDCSNLDRYVILNRVMALIASLIAFGGLGLAIAAVVIHF